MVSCFSHGLSAHKYGKGEWVGKTTSAFEMHTNVPFSVKFSNLFWYLGLWSYASGVNARWRVSKLYCCFLRDSLKKNEALHNVPCDKSDQAAPVCLQGLQHLTRKLCSCSGTLCMQHEDTCPVHLPKWSESRCADHCLHIRTPSVALSRICFPSLTLLSVSCHLNLA